MTETTSTRERGKIDEPSYSTPGSNPSAAEVLMADAIDAASFAAANAVFEYASRFGQREDYEPLEELAGRVQHAAVRAGAKVARDARRSTA